MYNCKDVVCEYKFTPINSVILDDMHIRKVLFENIEIALMKNHNFDLTKCFNQVIDIYYPGQNQIERISYINKFGLIFKWWLQ